MKIKVKNKDNKDVVLEATTTLTGTTPDGKGFYSVVYQLNGETVYRLSSGATATQPSPVEALDWEKLVFVECDDGNITKVPFIGQGVVRGMNMKVSHRQLLLEALESVVI